MLPCSMIIFMIIQIDHKWFLFSFFLFFRCMPAFVKYRFFKQPEHTSFGREQDDAIYWDDINVVLAGEKISARCHNMI